jgi:flagellar biogenesis protein FliO
MHSLQDAVQGNRTKTASPGGLAEWLLGLLGGARSKRQAAVKQMQLLETLPLGGKRNLMLVRCAEELFLVGGSAEGVASIVRVQSGASENAAAKGTDDLCL